MKSLLCILLLAVLFVASVCAQPQEPTQETSVPSTASNPHGGVRVLTDLNFEHDTQLATGGTTGDWFVEFYAPWCGHCKRLAPVWEQVAARLDGKVNVAKVNVDENPSVAARFNIRSLPTIRYFRAGKSYAYEGERTLEDLVRFASGGYASKKSEPIPAGPSFLETLEIQVVPVLQNLENKLVNIYQETILPLLEQHVLPHYHAHVVPVWNNHVVPTYEKHVEPFYRTNVVPLYHEHAVPFYNNKVVPFYNENAVPFYNNQVAPFWSTRVVPTWRNHIVPQYHARALPALNWAINAVKRYAVWYAHTLKSTGWFDGIVDPVALEKDLDHILQYRKIAVGLLLAWSFSAGLLITLLLSACCSRRTPVTVVKPVTTRATPKATITTATVSIPKQEVAKKTQASQQKEKRK